MASNAWLKRHRRLLLFGVPAVALVIIAVIYLTGGRYVSTDDAYVQAARTDISTNVSGRVTQINVHDNQLVHTGDALFKLDDRDFAIAVANANAGLANEKLRISALKATYRQRVADVATAQTAVTYQQKEFERQETLARQGVASQSQLDQARRDLDTAQQQVKSVEQERENIRAQLGDNPDIDVNTHPSVQAAKAAVDRAQLDLSRTVITAPMDGIVARVENLQVGDYVTAAVPVFALVSRKNVWMEANFKETDVKHLRTGQDATIKVDAYSGRVFHGKVMSTSPGTGSSFSVLPPENATGNWVKVVQRVPVRVSIDDADTSAALHAGLSATVKIDTHSDSEHKQ
jgi:membrane fusion protein (multidrug efflux system)